MFKDLGLKFGVYTTLRKSGTDKYWDKLLTEVLNKLDSKTDQEVNKCCSYFLHYDLIIDLGTKVRIWICNRYFSYGESMTEGFKGMPSKRNQVRLAKLEQRIKRIRGLDGESVLQSKLKMIK